MRKALFLAAIVMLAVACKKETGCTDPLAVNYNPEAKKSSNDCVAPAQERKVLLIEITAIWCPPCGSWGTPAFKQMLADYPDDIIGMAIHGSQFQPDVLTTDAGATIFQNFPVTGFPNFIIGPTHIGTSQTIDDDMNDLMNMPVKVSGAMIYEIKDGVYHLDAKVQTYDDISSTHYLAMYLIEDGIAGGDDDGASYDQKGDQSNDYTHDHVLRAAAYGQAFGKVINSGPAGSDESFDFNTTVDVQQDWKTGNQHWIGVIWKKENGKYIYVNAFEGVDGATLQAE